MKFHKGIWWHVYYARRENCELGESQLFSPNVAFAVWWNVGVSFWPCRRAIQKFTSLWTASVKYKNTNVENKISCCSSKAYNIIILSIYWDILVRHYIISFWNFFLLLFQFQRPINTNSRRWQIRHRQMERQVVIWHSTILVINKLNLFEKSIKKLKWVSEHYEHW